MTRPKAIAAGLLAGFVAAVVMTTTMLLLATLGVATPLVIIGDRLSVFISPGPFLSLMGKVGGYNHLKQLGVGSTIAGQLIIGAIGGALYALLSRSIEERSRGNGNAIRDSRIALNAPAIWAMVIFVLLPIVVFAIALWPVLGTSYIGLPIQVARLVTLIGFALSVFLFERTLLAGLRFLTTQNKGTLATASPSEHGQNPEFTPA
ncbi:MAG: hypothetical protein ACM3NN_00630, partial [Nitrospirota bacterium]